MLRTFFKKSVLKIFEVEVSEEKLLQNKFLINEMSMSVHVELSIMRKKCYIMPMNIFRKTHCIR